jgi:type II secretory pathway pseudopilin PulG
MKTLLIILLVVIAIAIVAAIAVLLVFVARRGQREYQKYSGLEHQRAAATQSRQSGVDRLKDANRYLVDAQRSLIARGDHAPAQDVEHLRTRLSTLADRTRFATHGYAPLGSPNPVRDAELAELQAHDAETITDAQMVTDLCQQLSASVHAGDTLDLHPLEAAVGHLSSRIDARSALT